MTGRPREDASEHLDAQARSAHPQKDDVPGPRPAGGAREGFDAGKAAEHECGSAQPAETVADDPARRGVARPQ